MNSFVASRLAVFVVVAFALVGAVSERSARAQVGSVTDSVAAAVTPDSAGADSDTTDNALANLSRDVQDVGRDIVSGNFTQLKRRFQALIGSIAVDFFPRMIGALVVLLVSLVVYWLVKVILGRTLKHSRAVDAGLEHILMRTYRIVVLTFIAVLVLSQFGVNVAALLAGLSVVGIAVGFAAQDTVQNYIAGITILIDKPFSVGDNVEINGVFGSVNKITLRSTRVRTQNGEIMVMPNVQMINQKLINHTALPTLRVEIPFGIAYKEFPYEARKVVIATTEGDDRLDPDQPPEVVVTQMNSSSVDLSLRLFLKNPHQELRVRFDYMERVREALREADIEIPFPHLQLFIDEAKAFEESYLMRKNGGSESKG
ncbi:MAG: mechanosensitive ion channel family protein [Bacteroidetes bacterium]|nr:mechanosensitive ion channel family protein [Bacteroidota bacterium]